ncbi:hypothetical protein [Thermomonospora amylolytica]|uniref:hypothetical protein n=1 Tax=Thermomonospora amylolytica TaxID=1411117 RepID=UPI000E6BCD1B|nr:hypothetical protein [Thermomonospora amylolytica]
MGRRAPAVPPRPIAPGDLVAAFSDALGEWTAAQIIRLDPVNETAGVLELDWSGPEPGSVADLGDVSPLRLTHHSWNGTLSYHDCPWVLPRSHKVIGALPLLHDRPSNAYGAWRLGDQLARQRRWDGGVRQDPAEPWRAEYTGAEIDRLLAEPAAPRPDIRELHVRGVTSLDCGRLVERFPHLTDLHLHGDLGLLTAAERLNELTSLRSLHIVDLFGMSGDDRLLPHRVPALETLCLSGVPAEYATAMRSAWRPEIPNGTYVEIRRARTPEWVAENRDNPLRDWDGRANISRAAYGKAVAQYKATRRAVMAVLSDDPADDRVARLAEIGREYGEAFNRLDRRTGFIETVEREELFDALDHIVQEAEDALGLDLTWARDSLASGADSVRDW